MKHYRLKADRFEHKAGTVVYPFDGYDYGCTGDDVRATGKPHTTITLAAYGGHPFFTVPTEDLEDLGEFAGLEAVTQEHARAVCKMGQQAECCRYLTVGAKGLSCEKLSSLGMTLDMKARNPDFSAKGDNCEGRASL